VSSPSPSLYRYGITEIDIDLDHNRLRDFFDRLSLRYPVTDVNSDFVQYSRKWTEIALIRNYQLEEPSLCFLSEFQWITSLFNTGIRYMSFYSAHPGLCLHLHRDRTGNLAQGYIRLHVPVYTSSEAYYLFGNAHNPLRFNALQDHVYALDTGYLHGISIESDSIRTHLMLELEVNHWMKKLLPPRTIHFYFHLLALALVYTPLAFIRLGFRRPHAFLSLLFNYSGNL
jgi:hypothetical protein